MHPHTIFSCNRLIQCLFVFTLLLSMNLPLSANQGDWAQVERFNKHLENANQGNVSAMYEVAKLYERGRGTNVNLPSAAKWYEKASNAGDASAKSRLGIMYFEGRGVSQNYNKALRLLNSAVKENIPSAQHQLASMYELGTGVPQNLKKAIHWYTQAERNGYYLAEDKIPRLKKLLRTGGTKKASSPKTSYVNVRPTALMQSIANGHWFKRKKAVGYLPSNITNCVNDAFNSLHCISNTQERSTGSEIITYNTESNIKLKNNKSFEVVYANNVLNVTALAVEDGDGNLIEQSPSRIKKGKQGKKRKLTCRVKNSKMVSCSKGTSSFDLISR
jgi:Sel1 repeat